MAVEVFPDRQWLRILVINIGVNDFKLLRKFRYTMGFWAVNMKALFKPDVLIATHVRNSFANVQYIILHENPIKLQSNDLPHLQVRRLLISVRIPCNKTTNTL